MFARRNSITLAIIWLFLLGVGIFLYVQDTRKLLAAKDQQVDLSGQLRVSQTEINKLKGIEDKYAELSEKWLNLPKKMVAADEPAFTLSYLNWIMTTFNLDIDFDFVLNHKKELEHYTKFSYTLKGESTYNEILKLIWHLTNNSLLYKINSLNLTQSSDQGNLLKFSVKLEGYSVSEELQIEEFTELAANNYPPMPKQYDIFNPLVREKPKVVQVKKELPKLPAKLPGQIDVEKATLQAVTNGSVFIKEGAGKVVELKIGDPVYLGRLASINPQSSEALFIITKFGISQRVTLSINYRQ